MNRLILVLICIATILPLQGQALYEKPQNIRQDGPVQKTGREKGSGGMANGGRKGSPSFRLKAGEQRTLAEAREQPALSEEYGSQ